MAELLSPDWLSAAERALDRRLPAGRPGVPVVQVAVTSPKAPDTRWWVQCAPDRVTVRSGSAGVEPTVSVSLSRSDLGALLDGRMALDVGFMQGRVKVEGSTAPVLALLAWSAGADFAAARRDLAQATDVG